MGTLVLSVLVFALAMAAMAIGIMFGRGALRSGCHCVADENGPAVECEGCPRSVATTGNSTTPRARQRVMRR